MSTKIYTIDILLVGSIEWERVYQHYSPDLSESVTLQIVDAIIEEYSQDAQIEKIRCSIHETEPHGRGLGKSECT